MFISAMMKTLGLKLANLKIIFIRLYANSNSYTCTHTCCTVLELQTARNKVTDLETKIQRVEERQTEQNRGEFLFTIILFS